MLLVFLYGEVCGRVLPHEINSGATPPLPPSPMTWPTTFAELVRRRNHGEAWKVLLRAFLDAFYGALPAGESVACIAEKPEA
jgi:hypothetical protein